MHHVLGIESSCDETAIAIVRDDKTVLAHQIYSQTKEHADYGGVVPEIAARAHLDVITQLLQRTSDEAQLPLSEIDAFAVTAGPGLIGGVIVGVMAAKTLAMLHSKPLIAVNHLEAHALTVRLTHAVEFPYLLLLVSGGHCFFAIVEGVQRITRLGGTLDDALGEAFDKTAKMMGLGYPGGPIIERIAKEGNPNAYKLPRPLHGKAGCDFSFSGLKTAVRLELEKQLEKHGAMLTSTIQADMAASFQTAVADVLHDRLRHAIAIARAHTSTPMTHVVVAGGVAANQFLMHKLRETAAQEGLPCLAPPPALCTDNGAMVAWAGMEYWQQGITAPLTLEPRARWPIGVE